MNIWKGIAIASVSALVLTNGYRAASASPDMSKTQIAERQPNMEAALAKLREAKGALERSEHDKGGWRTKAIEAINVSIKETERGMAFADTH